ncbi:SPOR domain-containing protein [uncultured Tateyamaria sp.]|uniref:SPOR domain-containing protein n=1 Tax=uncultured Tateyamaria sp. TaxID=455651 RepID=UPI00262C28F1|nr:SPOR domain-containing protein [uncultured Tateyamaria sp.]
MKVTRIVALAVIAASFGIGASHAQNLRNAQAPAEFPPASFKGSQYIDSQGCVFIRAGIDGNVTWVPRVNRQRRLICGQTPTLSANAAQAARTTPQQSASTRGVEQITVPTPAPQTAAPAPVARAPAAPAAPARVATPRPVATPAPTTRRVVTAPAPKPVQRVQVRRPAPVATPVAPKVVVAPKPKPKPAVTAPAPRTAAVKQHVPACPGASPISGRYINSGEKAPVRCGPQPVTRSSARGMSTTVATPQETRVVPRHVFDARQRGGPKVVPEGYRPVWEDDRLNPRRAEQNLEGIARSRLIWTNTVPRRLIDQPTGRDVTTKVPLVYPFTDQATQTRDLGTVTLVRRNGVLMKRIVRNKAKAAAQQVTAAAPVARQQAAPTRKAKAQVAVPGRYVQVGTYGQPSNATAAAQRISRAGLPVRMGKLTRKGKTYQVVLAGPFTSSSTLNNGLNRSRAAGFGDAFIRK